jgi:hypothetical protein
MSRIRIAILAAAAAAALAWCRPAEAGLSLGLGADYWVDPEVGAFQLTLAVDRPLARRVTAAARVGLLVTSGPNDVAVPIDLRLRMWTRRSRLYFEGLVGPWLFFDGDDWLRAHVGLGLGILSKSMSLGVEVGWLDPSAILGIRLGFRL